MKTFSLAVITMFVITFLSELSLANITLNSDTIPKKQIGIFYSEDFVAGDQTLIISAMKRFKNGRIRYFIHIEPNGSDVLAKSFPLAQIRPNPRTINSLIQNLEKEIKSINPKFADFMKKHSNEFINLNDLPIKLAQDSILQPEDREAIKYLTSMASKHLSFDSRFFEKKFIGIDTTLKANGNDRKWLANEISNSKVVSISKKIQFRETLKSFSENFLMNAYVKNLKKDSLGQKVGVIYARNNVRIYSNIKLRKEKGIPKINKELSDVLQDVFRFKNPSRATNIVNQLNLKEEQLAIIGDKQVLKLFKKVLKRHWVEYELDDPNDPNILKRNIKDIIENIIEAIINFLEQDMNILDINIEFENDQIKNIKVKGSLLRLPNDHFKTNSSSWSLRNSLNFFTSSNKDVKKFKLKRDTIIFQNRVPISYSTKKDISRDIYNLDSDIKLFSNKPSLGINTYVNFSDVFYNDYNLMNNTENYSPTNSIIQIRPGEEGKILYKEKVVNILQAKVYSDFVGLDSDEPNGLIQTEIGKRIFLNSRIHQIKSWYAYAGLFNSIYPKIIVLKLEENRKDLILNRFSNISNDLEYYGSTMDVLRHQNLSVGGEINLFYFGFPRIHTMFYVNFGGMLGRTSVGYPVPVDSINNIAIESDAFSVNAFNFYPELDFSFHPHPSYRFSFDAKYSFFNILSGDFQQINSPKKFFNQDKDAKSQMLSFKFTAAIKPNKDSKGELFFRWIYTLISNDRNQNFLQAQVGYSFNILSRNTK